MTQERHIPPSGDFALDIDMTSFSSVLASSKHIIAVAGAGLSAASGIPTFRGAGGMWRKYDAMNLATPEAFAKNPSRVWQFYHYRRERALITRPNTAHIALALFSIPSFQHQLAPESTFTLITQNVDGLSQIASQEIHSSLKLANETGAPAAGEQPQLIEMHGRLFDVVCTSKSCGHRELDFRSPVCPALAGTEKLVEAGAMEPSISKADLPCCKNCGALARPGVVWFGEMPHDLKIVDRLVSKADLCLVVGTSSTVYPAASYAEEVRNHGGKVAVFNLNRSDGDDDADFLFLGPCKELLPKALPFQIPPSQ
ncbi:hypothetical protein EW146_g7520 [Bondarzewia mesenterica]|uniref:NAD-dependent protein deacylase n=1 Tax=Bondarzewia mesenterica TaxID=1095465 RepID=A0A4S4LL59_9AGAM|nr:hypothetical protein EW146_g7520 [Bondarzewia mesenterica]